MFVSYISNQLRGSVDLQPVVVMGTPPKLTTRMGPPAIASKTSEPVYDDREQEDWDEVEGHHFAGAAVILVFRVLEDPVSVSFNLGVDSLKESFR